MNGDMEDATPGAGWTLTSTGGYTPPDVFLNVSAFNPLWAPLTTNVAWLGGYNDAEDIISQSVNTAGYIAATLSFSLAIHTADALTYDFLEVSFGGNILETYDLGDDLVTALNQSTQSFDLTPFLTSGNQIVSFRTTTDLSVASSAFIDNVSITATPVPEPATMAVLGLGAAAMLRRRKK